MDIYSLRPLGHFLVSPINHTLVFVLCIWVVTCIKPSWKILNKASILIGSSWLLLCSQSFFSTWLIAPLDNFAPIVKASDPVIQSNNSIFVLACFLDKQKKLPIVSGWHECSLQRLVQAVILYNKNPVPIYVSGGDFLSVNEPSYTDFANELLLNLGVKEEHIVLVPEGTNTMEEMAAVYPLLPHGQVAIVSTSTHMNRISKFDRFLNTSQGDLTSLLVPVDHLITRDTEFSFNIPASYSVDIVERALYEYLAVFAHVFSFE